MKKFIFFTFFLSLIIQANAQNVELLPTYHSIGIKVSNISNIDSCKVEYKKSFQSNWLSGYNLDKIIISGINQFRGSVFLLDENTFYDVRVTVFIGKDSHTLKVVQESTKNSPSFKQAGNVKWVSPNGSGNIYSEKQPGNLNSLFSSGKVTCGTTVILLDGIYYLNKGLNLNLKYDCTESTPIILMAATSANPIVHGGQKITTQWKLHPNINNLYSTQLPSGSEYSNICIIGNKALYPYPSINSIDVLGNYNLSELNFDFDGFVRDNKNIWIKTHTPINPNNENVIVSSSYRFLTVYGNNKNAFLKIKGISFNFFGKPLINSKGFSNSESSATVFDLRNVHHVYFDNCNFSYNNSYITFNNVCNNFTIQNCKFKHDVGKWSHAMIKKSLVSVHTILKSIPTSRGRKLENPAIFLDICKQGVIRNNYFDGINSGVASYYERGFVEEIDIYNNIFVDNFDAIECDGLWSNLRVWNNEIIRPMAGVSAAPPLIGPRYFYRNIFYGMKGRINEKDDPKFIGCNPTNENYISQGIGIKTNSSYSGNLPTGNLYFFNNTFHAQDNFGFVITPWTSEWRNALFINNSYSHQNSSLFFYFDLGNTITNKNFQITSKNENYFCYNNSVPIAVVKHIHGYYNCTDILNVKSLQNQLSLISSSPNISILNPTQNNPLFKNSDIGNYELNQNSPLINGGLIILGFYDYNGSKPDIGAKESNY